MTTISILATVILAATWPDLTTLADSTGGGEADAAVIVGIEDYAFVEDVAGARANAEAWHEWLTRVRGVPTERVQLLRDAEGADHRVRKAVDKAAGETGETGTLWFIYIGHGAPSMDGQDGLLVGVDANRSADGIYQRSISRSEILGSLEAGNQAQTVVVLDTCFSGQTSSGDALVEGLQPLVPTYAVKTGRTTVLTAARSDQFAGALPGADRPAFSYLVLGAMRGWGDADGNGLVTAREVVDYAHEALVTTVRDRTQQPELHAPDEGLVLARGSEPGPDLARLALLRTDEGSLTDLELQMAALQAEQAALALKLEQARSEELSRAEAALIVEAEADWAAVLQLIESSDKATAQAGVEAFISRYQAASVTVADTTYPVQVARLSEAETWIAEHNRAGTIWSTPLLEEHGVEMVWIDPGDFTMGTPAPGPMDDQLQHPVRLTRPFLIATIEYPRSLHFALKPDEEDYYPEQPPSAPYEVDWITAAKLCNTLSEREGLTPAYRFLTEFGNGVSLDRNANGFRLATEAEWEYAAKAGTTSRYAGGDDPSSVGWYAANSDGRQAKASAQKTANAWGLYDMSGNGAEWVWDWYAPFASEPAIDPLGPPTNHQKLRVLRGGSVKSEAAALEVGARDAMQLDWGFYGKVGALRLTRSPEPPTLPEEERWMECEPVFIEGEGC